MLDEQEDVSWYSRRADRIRGAQPGPIRPDGSPQREELLRRLREQGAHGDFESLTLFTRRLPSGCRGCLKGRGTNLFVTGLCTRECFFCFNEKPRRDEIVVHGIPIRSPEEVPALVERYGLSSVGISGGEPLLFPDRVLRIIRALRAMPRRVRIDLYTNGDRANASLLRKLKTAGLDAIRFDLAAIRYDTAPVAAAVGIFEEIVVELPVIGADLERLKQAALVLDRIGASSLVLHELFLSPENRSSMEAAGYGRAAATGGEHLLWSPVPGSLEAALEMLLFCLENTKGLNAYLCSCGTQEMISRRGYRRRMACRNLQPCPTPAEAV